MEVQRGLQGRKQQRRHGSGRRVPLCDHNREEAFFIEKKRRETDEASTKHTRHTKMESMDHIQLTALIRNVRCHYPGAGANRT